MTFIFSLYSIFLATFTQSSLAQERVVHRQYLILNFSETEIKKLLNIALEQDLSTSLDKLSESFVQTIKDKKFISINNTTIYHSKNLNDENSIFDIENVRNYPSIVELSQNFTSFDDLPAGKQILPLKTDNLAQYLVLTKKKCSKTQVASQDINSSNQDLSSNMFELQNYCSILEVEQYPLSSESMAFYRLTRSLKKGEPLTMKTLQKKNIVNFQQIVDFDYQTAGISLSGKALAKENGKINDFIKLENIDTKKIFSAKVIGFNKVALE